MVISKTIALTYGDPAGIGLEILNNILRNGLLPVGPEYVIFGQADLLAKTDLEVINTQDQTGYQSTRAAAEYCLEYGADLVTGPINKAKWIEAGHNYAGQTELLSEITGAQAEMLFHAGKDWRVLLLTRHIPLRDVPEALTKERLERALKTLRNYLSTDSPRIALSGLNPHAGENGEIGSEELQWSEWTSELGIEGIYSPDTLWYQAGRAYLEGRPQPYDCYLSPYHDQILPLIKTITNLEAVNVSIGLPFLRTSPDHGVAYDLVDTGQANIRPYLRAVELLCKSC